MDEDRFNISSPQCVPHGTATYTTVFGFGKQGDMRRCPGCGRWWFLAPGYSVIWYPVRWYHRNYKSAIRDHEARVAAAKATEGMHKLISSKHESD